jgi:hypothetical protein
MSIPTNVSLGGSTAGVKGIIQLVKDYVLLGTLNLRAGQCSFEVPPAHRVITGATALLESAHFSTNTRNSDRPDNYFIG